MARHPAPRLVVATTLVGMFATTFPLVVLVAAIPEIADDLDTRESLLAWVVTAPLLAMAVSMPVLGKLGDLHGHRRVFLSGFTAATVVAGLTAAAWDAASLIGFRTLGMVAAAATQPTAIALIMAAVPAHRRVWAMGLWSFVGAGSPAIGLVAGGPLIDLLGWRVIFLAQTGLAAVALATAAVVLRETPRRPEVAFDVRGSALLAVAVGALLFAVQQGADWSPTHPAVVAAAVTVAPASVAFVRAERSAPAPLLPLPVVSSQAFLRPIAALLSLRWAMMGSFVVTPLLLASRFDASVSTTSLLMVALPGGISLFSPVGGRLGERVGERRAVVAGALTQLASMAVMVAASVEGVVALVPVGLALLGASNGLARPSIAASVVTAVGEDHFGIGAATQRMASEVMGVVGIAVWVTVMASGGFTAAYLLGAATALVAVLVATRMPVASHRGPVSAAARAPGDRRPDAAVVRG